jgi:pimeloyl-ACP methyl ester carboxylesterase
VRLAYAVTGKGPPIVRAAHWLTHIEFDWASPVWRHWLAEFSRGRTLVRYDERGCGLSDWDAADLSFESWVRDLEVVVDAAGLTRFALIGISQGGAVAVATRCVTDAQPPRTLWCVRKGEASAREDAGGIRRERDDD